MALTLASPPAAMLKAHSAPPPRGPQEETSDRWRAAIGRRHRTAAQSLPWLSVGLRHESDTLVWKLHESRYALHSLLVTSCSLACLVISTNGQHART